MRTAAFLLICTLFFPAISSADDFTIWQVPWQKTMARDPAVDAEGRVWFVGQRGDYIGWLDPDTGTFGRHPLPDGTGPHNLIIGNDDQIWIAGNRVGWIGRMHPETGELKQFSTAGKDVDDPHTLVQGSDGRIWFTAQNSNRIGVFDQGDASLEVWQVPTPRARPYGIALDNNNQPWVVLLGTNKLATIADGKLHEIELPRDEARPRRVDVIDGEVWYVDYAAGYFGAYDQEDNTFREWPSPSGDRAAPYGAIRGAGKHFFYVETGPQPNRMIGVDTTSGAVVYNQEIPESGGAVRHMFHDAKRNAIWFGTDTGNMVRFDLP